MVKHILFDLDSTLYSSRYGLDAFFTQRLQEYVSSWLCLSPEEYNNARKDGLKRHGTTNPELRRFLETLPCPCSILTNSPFFHAGRVIKRLGLEGVFIHVFDIMGNGFKGKPHPSSYRRALGELGLKIEEVLFIDDLPNYVKGYLSLGGRGILLDEKDIHKDYPHERIQNLMELTRFLI